MKFFLMFFSLILGIYNNSYSQTFSQLVKAVASDREANAHFGISVSMSGNYAVVGAFVEDKDANGANALNDAGAAYIFKKDQNGSDKWGLVKKIVASDRAANDYFGSSVSIYGDYVIVGSYGDDEDASGGNSKPLAGSAYIFKKDAGGIDNWGQIKKIVASDRSANDYFGRKVSMAGDYLIVGAYLDTEDASGGNSKPLAGSAYIFKKDAGGIDNWGQIKKIVASDRGADDLFGYSVSISGDYAMVGAFQEDEDAAGINTKINSGSVYIYKRDQGGTDNWGQIKKLVLADRAANDYFGYTVNISGDYTIISAYGEDEDATGANTITDAGGAYIFKKDQGGIDNWGLVKKIVASDRIVNDEFGISASISGDYAVVGADFEDEDAAGTNTLSAAGSAYIFKKDQGGIDNWGQVQKIVSSDRATNDNLGISVSNFGDYIIVGTDLEDENASGTNTLSAAGSTYIFKKPSSGNIDPSLVLHYNFDACSATDLSGNNRNGTFLNSPTCTTSPLNQALALNLSTATSCGAGSYVQVPSFDPIWSQGITVCAWVDFGNVTTGERFIDFNTPASNSYVRFGREGNTNNLLVEKRFDEVYSVTSASNAIQNNQYAYYCMTISNSMVKIYINGSLIVQNAVNATNPIGNIRLTDCYLGRSWSYCERDFEGKIDDIKVYNRPLSDSEIQSVFTSSITIQSLTLLDNYTNTVITNASMYKTWLKRVRLKAQTSIGELILDQNLFTKTSSNPAVVAFESDGRFRGVSGGQATLTFSSGSVSTNLIVDVINPVYEPVFEPIPTFLATPAANAKKIIPVVILRYLPTQDGINNDTRYDPDFGSLNPIGLTQLKTDLDKYDLNVKYCLEEGTKFRGYKTPNAQPYLGYKVMAIITVYEPTPQGIILNYDNNGNIRYAPDFQQIFDRFNIKNYIENLGVRDIWFWSGGFDSQFPSYNPAIHKLEYFRGTWESNMSSAITGDISNSNRDPNDLPIYSQPYMVYGQNYRRNQAEAIHNRGHQYDEMLNNIDVRRNGNSDLFWKKFVGRDANGQFITGRCGWTHMPPNTIIGYDYTNTTLVESDCEDWTPQGTGQKKMVNASTWGNITYNWPQPTMNQKTETQFYTYWFQNHPGYLNQIQHSPGFEMSNWWEIIGNFDSAVVNSMNLFKVKSIVIPVELIDITAKANEQKNLIEWQTASEVNFKGFAIERLIGNSWEKLGFIPAYGKGSHYQFTDEYPLSISYYRLRQIDNDGKETFSKVVNVQRNGKSNIKIYPSVVESELRVKYEDVNKSMEVQIVNIMGQVVYQQAHTFSNGEMVLNVSSLQAGTYFLQIDNNTAKIIKK